jgi:hypothetical protein
MISAKAQKTLPEKPGAEYQEGFDHGPQFAEVSKRSGGFAGPRAFSKETIFAEPQAKEITAALRPRVRRRQTNCLLTAMQAPGRMIVLGPQITGFPDQSDVQGNHRITRDEGSCVEGILKGTR